MSSTGTEQGRPDDDPLPASSPERTVEQLAAAHAIFRLDRQATECDILITTALEGLRDGAQTTDALVKAAQDIWPGTEITFTRMEMALQTAQGAGLVISMQSPDGPYWSLTTDGTLALGGAREWASEAVRRVAAQLQDRAAEAHLPITDAEAMLWVGILAEAAAAGIRNAYAAYIGEVTLLADQNVAARTYDKNAMFDAVRASGPREEVAEFLAATVVAMVDPSDPFGNELVTHITTAYILQAFLGRRDHLAARQGLGSLKGERAVLDTPVLILLLGPESQARPVERAIAEAVQLGVEVIVTDHTIKELLDVVDRVAREEVPEVERAISRGTDPKIFRQIVDGTVLRGWLAGMEAGRYRNWAEFLKAAQQMGNRVTALGVQRRAHHNTAGIDRVTDCAIALEEALRNRGDGHGRGPVQIERDANTMAMVARTRSKRRNEVGRVWPGSWVITTDRSMGPAYRRVYPRDQFPLTLTPSRWIALLSTCAKPSSLEELATSAAALVTQEAMLTLGAMYPPKIAIEIAQQLSADEQVSATDVRVAQLSPDEVLAQLPENAVGASNRIVGMVTARRTRRMSMAAKNATARMAAERDDSNAEAVVQAELARQEHAGRLEVERMLLDKEAEVQWIERDRAADLRNAHRREVARWIMAGGVIIMTVGILLHLYGFVAGTLVTIVFLRVRAREWANDEDVSWIAWLSAALPELLGVIDFFRH